MFVIQSYRQMGVPIIPSFTLGIVCGSILLTWLYQCSGGSVFIVALWHACYDLVSGTAAAHGAPAAIVAAGSLCGRSSSVVAEVRRGRRKNATRSTLTSAPI